MGGGGPNNLNQVEYDQPLERRQRNRFRPSEPVEIAVDGLGGDRNQFRGVGTDNGPDTGSSSSGVFAGWKSRRAPVEPTMPNAVQESDPQEEGAGTETNLAFNEMQQR